MSRRRSLTMEGAEGGERSRRASASGRLSACPRDSLSMEVLEGGLQNIHGRGGNNLVKWLRKELRTKKPNPFLESPARMNKKSRLYAPMDMGDEMNRLRMEKKYFDRYRERDAQKLQELKLYHNAAFRDRQVDHEANNFTRQREKRTNVMQVADAGGTAAVDFQPDMLKSQITRQLEQLKHQSDALRQMTCDDESSSSSSKQREVLHVRMDLAGLKTAFHTSKEDDKLTLAPKKTGSKDARAASKMTVADTMKPPESQLEQRKIFVRIMLEKFGGLDEAYDKMDVLKNGDVSRERIAILIDECKIPVTTRAIFGWLGDVVDYAGLAISREGFMDKARVFAWYLGYCKGGDVNPEEDEKAAMCGALELGAPLLGQRVHRPCDYYKLRHPLLKSPKELKAQLTKMVPLSHNILNAPNVLIPAKTALHILRDDAADAGRAKVPSPEAGRAVTGIDKRQSPQRKTLDARVPASSRYAALSSPDRSRTHASSAVTSSAGSPERSPARSARSPSVTIMEPAEKRPRLRERGGTLIFSKEEQKELRHRVEFCYLGGKKDALVANVHAPASSAEAKRELRSNYIRLLLFPNQKILVNPVIIQPTEVFWRYSDIKDMQAFYAKASTTTAKLKAGLVTCAYNPLLQRVKAVDELVDGGCYLLSCGGAIEYPLPLAFQQQKDIMERNITLYHNLSQDLRVFFRSLGAIAKPSTSASNHRSNRPEMCDEVEWERACKKLKGERNRRRAPAEWVRVLTRLGVNRVTADFFHWLTPKDALSTDQLVLALERPYTPVSAQLPAPPLHKRDDDKLLSMTLSNFMLELFPGKRRYATTSLGITKNKLKHNDERLRKNMNFLLEKKRELQHNNELLCRERVGLPKLQLGNDTQV